MVSAEIVVALVIMQASALLGVVGYIYKDMKRRDRRTKKRLKNIDERINDLEANLYGHEKGSEGYIVMTEKEIDEINEKLDSMKQQMKREHVEAKKHLGAILEWIEEEGNSPEELDLEYERRIDFSEEDD